MPRVYEKGQVTLPKAAREATGISIGDDLRVEVRAGEIVLRKVPSIFDYRPPRPRRDVELSDQETIEAAHEDRVAEKHGRTAGA